MPDTKETNKTTSPKRPNLYKPNDPPLFSFQVTNPVTYFKLWFKKVWAHEGIILHLRIRPLTVIVIALLLTGTSFGVSKYLADLLPFQLFAPKETSPIPPATPNPTANPWIETAYAGSLHKTDNRFYLIISSGEAITLETPDNIKLSTLVGKRILASGNYNQNTRTLKVIDAADMEVLPAKTIPVPVSSPSPIPIPTPTSTPVPTLIPTPTPSSAPTPTPISAL